MVYRYHTIRMHVQAEWTDEMGTAGQVGVICVRKRASKKKKKGKS